MRAENRSSREIALEFRATHLRIKARHKYRPVNPSARRGPGLAARAKLDKERLKQLRAVISRIRAGCGDLQGRARLFRPSDLDSKVVLERKDEAVEGGGGRLAAGERLTTFGTTPTRFTPLKLEDVYAQESDSESCYSGYSDAEYEDQNQDDGGFEGHDLPNENEINVPHNQNK